MPIKVMEDRTIVDFDGSGDIAAVIRERKNYKDRALSLRETTIGKIGRDLLDEEHVKDKPEVILNFSNAKSIKVIAYLLGHAAELLEGVEDEMSRHIGKTKDNDLIIISKDVEGYELKVGKSIEGGFETYEEAEKAAKKEMIWSYLPQLDESEVEGLIDSGLEIKYKWEWMR